MNDPRTPAEKNTETGSALDSNNGAGMAIRSDGKQGEELTRSTTIPQRFHTTIPKQSQPWTQTPASPLKNKGPHEGNDAQEIRGTEQSSGHQTQEQTKDKNKEGKD